MPSKQEMIDWLDSIEKDCRYNYEDAEKDCDHESMCIEDNNIRMCASIRKIVDAWEGEDDRAK